MESGFENFVNNLEEGVIIYPIDTDRIKLFNSVAKRMLKLQVTKDLSDLIKNIDRDKIENSETTNSIDFMNVEILKQIKLKPIKMTQEEDMYDSKDSKDSKS